MPCAHFYSSLGKNIFQPPPDARQLSRQNGKYHEDGCKNHHLYLVTANQEMTKKEQTWQAASLDTCHAALTIYPASPPFFFNLNPPHRYAQNYTRLLLTIQLLDAPKVIFGQPEAVCVHPLVEGSHDGTRVARVLQA